LIMITASLMSDSLVIMSSVNIIKNRVVLIHLIFFTPKIYFWLISFSQFFFWIVESALDPCGIWSGSKLDLFPKTSCPLQKILQLKDMLMWLIMGYLT
jgi:hypothetical protein